MDNEIQLIGKHVYYLQENNKELTINDILQPSTQSQFKKQLKDTFIFQPSNNGIWFKISIENKTEEALYLKLGRISIWFLDFYKPDAFGKYHKTFSGGNLKTDVPPPSLSKRYVLSLMQGKTTGPKTYYIRIVGKFPLTFPFLIGTKNSIIEDTRFREDWVTAIFCGCILATFLYNVFLLFSMRDILYFYYISFLACSFFTVTFFQNYPFFSHPWFWENIFIWSNLIAIFIGLFGIHYLRLVHYSTFLKKWIIFMVFILAFFFPILNYLKFIDFIFLVKAYLPTVTLFHFSLFLCGLYVYYKGYKPARFYTIAWGSLFLSIGIFFLIIHELLPFLLYADYIIYLGFTAEMAFFGLALGDRYNHIKKESEEIHKKHLVLIEKQKEILEQKVQERTEVLLLLNEELEQKNKDLDLRGKELQEVNRAKDKIFAIISHDLRSPIAALNSFLEIFSLKNIPPDKTLEYIDKLKNSIRNLQMTLDNLLQWAAGQLKGIKVEKQTFNILGVSESCRLLLQDIANTKGIQIQQEIPSDLEALADPEHIRLVLRNLLSNAIKFTEPGGTVSIQAVKVEGSIQLSVKDTGLGMSEELIANFTQNKLIQSQFGTQRESGTGLGLHLCKEFIELNGGEIRIKSKPGQGTKFIIKIPA